MKTLLRSTILGALLMLPGLASPVGSIAGTVKDASGALIPGVKLTLTNTGTNATLTVNTNPQGEFQFPDLPPAEYSLVAEANGFKKISMSAVVVQVDQITHLELGLEVGTLSESVQVEAVAPLLENDKSTLSSVIDERNIMSMPLNGRQALDLALVTPGVIPTATGTQVFSFNVAGARAQSNVYLWDGVSNMDTQVNSNLNNFRVADALEEFSIQTSVASAEFGRGTGGEVNMVTKSGSNAFHGTLFEYVRNSDFDATDFFINKAKGTKTPLHRNEFGGTFGGPIRKNKTFFFASYEEFRQVSPTVSSTIVPTLAQRAMVTDPISKNLLQFWPTPNTPTLPSGVNYVANIGASVFDYTGLIRVDHNFGDHDHLTGRFADYQGATFTPGALPTEGGNANVPVSRNGVIIENHTFSPTVLNELRLGYSRNQTFITVQDVGLDASKIFQINGVPLTGVVNGAQNIQDSGLPTVAISGGFASLGSTTNLPQGRITNTSEIYDNLSWISPFGKSKHTVRMGYHIRREQARRYLDSTERGSFTFTGTADTADFPGDTTASASWRAFANGQVYTSTFKSGSTLAYWDRFPSDFYIQDQYKAKDNLTINYGLRYEYPSAIYQTRNDAVNFYPGVGPVLLGTNQLLTINTALVGPASLQYKTAPFTASNSGVNSDKNNLGPVVGIAYTPRFADKIFGKDDTVIRAGFRVGYDDIFNNIPANMGLNAPYNLGTTQTAGVTQPATASNPSGFFPWSTGYNQNVPLVKTSAVAPGGVGLISFSAEDPNIRSAYVYQYNMGIQRRFAKEMSFELDYQGSTGHKLGIFVDYNQPQVIVNNPNVRGNQAPNVQVYPYPTFSSIDVGKDIGNSNYNGMVATYNWRHKGYFLQASYTLSHSIDDMSAFFGSTGSLSIISNGNNINLDRASSDFDTRQRFVGVYNMDLPIGTGHRVFGGNNLFDRYIVGGWQVSGIVSAQTGQPFTVYDSAADFSGFNQLADRPNVIGSGPLPTNYSNPDAAFSTSYFSATPPTGVTGNSGRNAYIGPGLFNWDNALLKTVPLGTERMKLTIRADFFNFFNNTNFALPGHNEGSSSTFGKITSTVGSAVATSVGTTAGAFGGPRQIQFSARLVF